MSGPVHVDEIQGGQVVRCTLCGKRFGKRFWAADTNYAEALRLAIAYASMHEKSEAHAAARLAFSEHVPLTAAELRMYEMFGSPPPEERARRIEAARNAARAFVRIRARDRQREQQKVREAEDPKQE